MAQRGELPRIHGAFDGGRREGLASCGYALTRLCLDGREELLVSGARFLGPATVTHVELSGAEALGR
eukprot:2433290-Lingulodinium_polyedra.AAC.1